LPPLFRISGEIILTSLPPLSREDTKRLCYSLLNEEQKKVFERDWQLCCSVFDDKLGRFRVSVYYRLGNPEMAIRSIMDHIKKRVELRLPEQIDDLTRLSSGLVLVTGPTGTGKTTTMNYMIDLINSERRCKIIAIEDPVEYVHHPKRAVIIQQELYTDVKSFGSALIHVLRQDPDVICIGEMRDMDTTATALVAAETGHLVIATCHTSSIVQTAERIVSIFPPDQQAQIYAQLASSLQGVLAQQLVPSADKKRRLLATEFLLVNHAARKHIHDRELNMLVDVMQTGRRAGMHMMDDSLMELYEAGEITYENAINCSYHPLEMRKKIHQQNGSSEKAQ
jgi:twitching motility protein PilT